MTGCHEGYAVFTTVSHQGYVRRFVSHNKKNRYGGHQEREGGPGWAARRPARHGNEEADVSGGGGGGGCRGGGDRRCDARRRVVGRRGGGGGPPEWGPPHPGRNAGPAQEKRSTA